jgi:hypothetical protein
MDRRLSIYRKLRLRLHLIMCRLCAVYSRHPQLLRAIKTRARQVARCLQSRRPVFPMRPRPALNALSIHRDDHFLVRNYPLSALRFTSLLRELIVTCDNPFSHPINHVTRLRTGSTEVTHLTQEGFLCDSFMLGRLRASPYRHPRRKPGFDWLCSQQHTRTQRLRPGVLLLRLQPDSRIGIPRGRQRRHHFRVRQRRTSKAVHGKSAEVSVGIGWVFRLQRRCREQIRNTPESLDGQRWRALFVSRRDIQKKLEADIAGHTPTADDNWPISRTRPRETCNSVRLYMPRGDARRTRP